MITVYIASPYTLGDVAVNVRTQIDCAKEIRDAGFCPFVPLLMHFEHMIHPRPYEDWMKHDLYWMLQCDCVLRLPGESKGADQEVETAYKNNKLVFYSMTELQDYFQRVQVLK